MDFVEGVGESSSPPRSFGGFANCDVRNDVYNRLVETGQDQALSNPDFREQLEAHFNRLPPSYVLDVNMDRAEDVLLHQSLLTLARDPEKRPVFHVRFLELMDQGFEDHLAMKEDDIPADKLATWKKLILNYAQYSSWTMLKRLQEITEYHARLLCTDGDNYFMVMF